PCYNYTVLDNPWRATSNTLASVFNCDQSVTWSGWYRLFINGLSAYIPQTCVARYSCGTDIALWIRGGHPTVEDGVVTRDVCGNLYSYCCYYGSYPIQVKACPGNYYVYELVRPTECSFAYCADVGSINASSTAVTPATISTGINIMLQEGCTTVTNILTVAFSTSEKILESSLLSNPTELASFGNLVLKTSEKLISTLVKPTDTSDSVSFTLAAVEGQVFMVGPNVTLDKIPRLDTTNSSVDIDLIGIANNNNGKIKVINYSSTFQLNMILFIKIVTTVNSALKNLNVEVSKMKQNKIMAFKTLAQCVVLGCPWILGFFTNGSKELEILFLILNSQQGTFIFLIYCVLNNEVRQQYRKFFRCLCCDKQH
ncbi:hypothetical protein cypCar_00046961, partial [Cyprinus carpio]